MAGSVDLTQKQTPTTISEAQSQIDTLESARQDLRGTQQTAIKDLFSYDKALADRYSSPDSKMYIENAANREKAISGYFGAGKGNVTNLFDIMESVRTSEDKLKTLLDDLKKKSGSGGSTIGLSDINDFFGKEGEIVPVPPKSVSDAVSRDPTMAIYYNQQPDGSYYFAAAKKGKPPAEWMKEYSPELSQAQDKGKILSDYFGIDKATVAQLNAIATYNPKLADKLLTQMISSNVKSQVSATNYTTDDYVQQIKGYKTRAAALADLNNNRSAMIAKGVDVARLEREIDTYFTKQEETSGGFDLEALKKARGQ